MLRSVVEYDVPGREDGRRGLGKFRLPSPRPVSSSSDPRDDSLPRCFLRKSQSVPGDGIETTTTYCAFFRPPPSFRPKKETMVAMLKVQLPSAGLSQDQWELEEALQTRNMRTLKGEPNVGGANKLTESTRCFFFFLFFSLLPCRATNYGVLRNVGNLVGIRHRFLPSSCLVLRVWAIELWLPG